MGQGIRKAFTPTFKANVALEATRGVQTPNQLAGRYSVHPTQIGVWKKKLVDNAPRIFSDQDIKEKEKDQELLDHLYKKIGKQEVEIEWLKKKVGLLE
jgi:transposase